MLLLTVVLLLGIVSSTCANTLEFGMMLPAFAENRGVAGYVASYASDGPDEHDVIGTLSENGADIVLEGLDGRLLWADWHQSILSTWTGQLVGCDSECNLQMWWSGQEGYTLSATFIDPQGSITEVPFPAAGTIEWICLPGGNYRFDVSCEPVPEPSSFFVLAVTGAATILRKRK